VDSTEVMSSASLPPKRVLTSTSSQISNPH